MLTEHEILAGIAAGPMTLRRGSVDHFDRVVRLCLRLYRRAYVLHAAFAPDAHEAPGTYALTLHTLTAPGRRRLEMFERRSAVLDGERRRSA